MDLLIKNIGLLAGIVPEGFLRKEGPAMDKVICMTDAYLRIDGEKISDFSSMSALSEKATASKIIDARGGIVMPAFCDSHTHICFAGTREREFIDKLNGLTYAQIAERGGGILNSADLLHRTSEDELYAQTMERVGEMTAKGTGAIEIKSGYGLNTEDEMKMLRVIRRVKETSPALVRATFLGAHAIGRGCTHEKYVDLVCEEMIPRAAGEGLADFVDVFCEKGFFTVEDADRIMSTGERYGLVPKIHGNQLARSGGVQIAARHNALSVDHLEDTGEEEIEALRGKRTMPTMLPGSSFFLDMQYGKAGAFIDAGLGLALASDYNPGSSPSGDMRFVMALGCIKMKLSPERSFNACTLNSAYAMGVSDIAGSVTPGKLANLIITRPLPTLAHIVYCYESPFIAHVLLRGKEI